MIIIWPVLSENNQLKNFLQDDIYGSCVCNPVSAAAEIKATVLYPATEEDIEQYVFLPFHLIDQTAEVYNNVTLPYLESSSLNIQWIFNIFEHNKEADRIFFEESDPNNGFVLLPDLNWDRIWD